MSFSFYKVRHLAKRSLKQTQAMKKQWAPQELTDHWMLNEAEIAMVNQYGCF